MYFKYNIFESPFRSVDVTWMLVSVIIAIVAGVAIYFTFLDKKNDGKYKGAKAWWYDFLTFKKLVIEDVLKICYIITALYITLSSFAFISSSFLTFLGVLLVGNLIARIVYELALILVLIWRNTSEINKKLKADVSVKEELKAEPAKVKVIEAKVEEPKDEKKDEEKQE